MYCFVYRCLFFCSFSFGHCVFCPSNYGLWPLTVWVRTPLRRGLLDTTLCHKVCQWLAAGRWFSPGSPVSATKKTDLHDLTEILVKVVLNTITHNLFGLWSIIILLQLVVLSLVFACLSGLWFVILFAQFVLFFSLLLLCRHGLCFWMMFPQLVLIHFIVVGECFGIIMCRTVCSYWCFTIVLHYSMLIAEF